MNYIPGFSNYLAASVPEYGAEPIMDAPRQAAVEPMTQEAAAPYDLSGLAGLDLSGLNNLYGMNFGSDFGGGAMGGVYPDNPNLQYIGAPTSNKGNATGRSAGNTFTMTPDQPVRLVDLRTNQIVFEGTGYDAARKATELGQNLTDTLGRKASYDIQTADPSGVYTTVANEKKNKSTLGEIANVVGTALPAAAMFIPGLNVLGGIAAGAGLGGAGAALKGDNILKGAAMGGLSAAGGSVLGPAFEAGGKFGTSLAPRLATAVGTGIGSTAGGLATGQNLKNSLLGGVASGGLSYLSPNIQEGLGIGKAPSANTSGGGNAPSGGDIVVSGYRPTSIGTSLGGSPNKIQQALNQKTEVPYDGLSVTGNRLGAFGVNLGGNQFGAPGQDQSVFDKMYSEPYDPNEILVKATPATQSTPVSVPVTGGLSPDVLAGITEFEKNPIISEGSKIAQAVPVSVPVTGALPTDIVVNALGKEKGLPEGSVVGGLGIPQVPTPDPALTNSNKLTAKDIADYLRLASLGVSTVGGLLGGGKGGGATGTIPAGMGALSPLFSKQLPTSTLPSGGALSAPALAEQGLRQPQDYYRYGYGPEQSFFSHATQGAPNTSQAYTGYAGGGRAVEGAGDGREDKIPALLSDGEYVIDAETVALLGNGSNKAGAELLDNFRVKVRKQKGKKLARGEFSDNAKRPEQYMAGGHA
jgi:hypothetical protein